MTNVPLPPLHALVAFEALVRHGAVAPALAELGVTRAALTNSLAQLEERTGLRLLVRHTPSVELTAEGADYYQAVSVFARGAADALHALDCGRETEIRLAASPGVSRLWLAPQLARLRAACPGVSLSVSVSEALSDLERNQCDIAVRYCRPDDYDSDARLLWHEELAVIARAADATALALASPAELLTAHALLEHPAFSWQRLAERSGTAMRMREPDLVCHDMYAVLMACARGEGLALLPQRLTAGLRRRLGLVVAHPLRVPAKSYVLLYSAAGRERAVVRACADVLAAMAAVPEA
jgi:LysR family glycine cleavage system transcriptional activator